MKTLAKNVKDEIFSPMKEPEDDPCGYQEMEQATRNVMDYYIWASGVPWPVWKGRSKKFAICRPRRPGFATSLREPCAAMNPARSSIFVNWQFWRQWSASESGRCVYRVREFPNLNPEMAKLPAAQPLIGQRPGIHLPGKESTPLAWN